jgi:tetratricopeptide (TPR) repeat protein
LIYAATDAHLWARDYERELADVLKLESEVALAVADEIRVQVTADESARLASARSINPQAHEAYLLGQYHFSKLNEDDLRQAIEYFERAIQLAPGYAALTPDCPTPGVSGASGERRLSKKSRCPRATRH